jgi:NADH:ubiquinone oxidoreductase subunit 6 (subunit J)
MTEASPGPLFWLLATAIVCGALGVVAARNMVHSALCLAWVLLMVGGLYLHLGADLLGGVQVLIYVGAVVTLMLIAIMLIAHIAARDLVQTTPRWGWGAALASVCAIVLGGVLLSVQWPVRAVAATSNESRLRDLCYALLDKYLLPFEVASVLLLVAMVGAIVVVQQTRVGAGEPGKEV